MGCHFPFQIFKELVYNHLWKGRGLQSQVIGFMAWEGPLIDTTLFFILNFKIDICKSKDTKIGPLVPWYDQAQFFLLQWYWALMLQSFQNTMWRKMKLQFKIRNSTTFFIWFSHPSSLLSIVVTRLLAHIRPQYHIGVQSSSW